MFLNKLANSRFSISLAIQGTSSLSNFLLGIYAIRALTLEGYGLYTLVFTIILFFAGINSSVILNQLTVLGSKKNGEDRIFFIRQITEIAFFLTIISLFISFIIFVSNIYFDNNYLSSISLIALGTSGYILRDFHLRYCFLESQEIDSLYSIFFSTLFIVISISIIHFLNINPTFEIILSIYSLSQIFCGLIGVHISKILFNKINLKSILVTYKFLYNYGKWNFINNLVYFARNHAYSFIITLFVSLEELAKANATRIFFSPMYMILPSFSISYLPKLSEQFINNTVLFKNLSNKLIIIITSFALLYVTLFFIFGEQISTFILGDKYTDIKLYLFLWSIWIFLVSLKSILETIAQSMNKFKEITQNNIVGSLITILFSILFTYFYGATGAILGLILSKIYTVTVLKIKITK